jgi:two-component system sensor histidine kinase YesM
MSGLWSRLSFTKKLFLLFSVIGSIPVLLLGMNAYRMSAQVLESQGERDLQVIANQLLKSIERQITDFDRFTLLPYYTPEAFAFLKSRLPAEAFDYAQLDAQKKLLRLMSAYPSINASIKGMVLYDMNGRGSGYRISSSSQLKDDYSIFGESWFRQAVEGKGRFIVTGLHEANHFSSDSFLAITGARLIVDDDLNPLAVLAIHISPEFIGRIVKATELQDAYIAVTDASGNPVYLSREEYGDDLPVLAAQTAGGTWELEDRNFYGVVEHSDYLGWTLYLGQDRDKLFEGLSLIRNFTVYAAVILVLAAGFVSYGLARGLSTPIQHLIKVMREVEIGKFVIPDLLNRKDEIGQLYLNFSRMVKRLEEMVQSIEEKERQKRHAELYAQRARIQPHFLYNTLNSIRMLAILQQNSQIAGLILSLNKLLKAIFQYKDDLVPLREEIEWLKSYAELMDLRYTNTFVIRWNIPEPVQDASMPPLLLQPVLENAIFHAARGLNRELNITISAHLGNDRVLNIEVADDGIGMTDEQMAGLLDDRNRDGRVGLRNVHERIRLRFGMQYGVSLARPDGPGTCVRIRLPYLPISQGGKAHVESDGRGG